MEIASRGIDDDEGVVMEVELFSPAKLTKYLRVTGVRSDGMHEIESEMVSLSFGDNLELSDGSGIEIVDALGILAKLEGDLRTVPADESNLVAKALKFVGRDLNVRLLKRIPPGSGLGGGSSNAAAILRYFRGGELLTEAVQLGADVPFCVRGGRAIARGVGEFVEPLPYDFETFVLLLSPFGVSTKEVYRQFDVIGSKHDGLNDLEVAALLCEPRLAESKDLLYQLSGVVPTLAGSGSAFFIAGTFENLELPSVPTAAEGFRYVKLDKDGSRYFLIETSTLPELV